MLFGSIGCFSIYLWYRNKQPERMTTHRAETETRVLRSVDGYTLQKVKRNHEGSYAIFKGIEKSKTQYNAGTVKKALMKMTDEDFKRYSEEQFTSV